MQFTRNMPTSPIGIIHSLLFIIFFKSINTIIIDIIAKKAIPSIPEHVSPMLAPKGAMPIMGLSLLKSTNADYETILKTK